MSVKNLLVTYEKKAAVKDKMFEDLMVTQKFWTWNNYSIYVRLTSGMGAAILVHGYWHLSKFVANSSLATHILPAASYICLQSQNTNRNQLRKVYLKNVDKVVLSVCTFEETGITGMK